MSYFTFTDSVVPFVSSPSEANTASSPPHIVLPLAVREPGIPEENHSLSLTLAGIFEEEDAMQIDKDDTSDQHSRYDDPRQYKI